MLCAVMYTSWRHIPSFQVLITLLAALVCLGGNDPGPEASVLETLDAAFRARYELDLSSDVRLTIRDKAGTVQERQLRVVSKLIDSHLNSLIRLSHPAYLRDMTLLTIEGQGRGHDTVIYLPSLQKVRRITTSQKGDSFFGSDVTYEDLERLRVANFDVGGLSEEMRGGEAVYLIEARPKRKTTYARVVFVIAKSDYAILETHYYKRDQEEPFRIYTAPREAMITEDGHVIPTRLRVVDKIRRSSTDIEFTNLKINPPLDDRLFSVRTLESKRPLP